MFVSTERQSVRAIRDNILKFQGLNLSTNHAVHGGGGIEAAAQEAERLEACAKQVISVVVGAVIAAVKTDSTTVCFQTEFGHSVAVAFNSSRHCFANPSCCPTVVGYEP